jgi:sigma-B regulation protein RsbU (phosphoserine phosphatase)
LELAGQIQRGLLPRRPFEFDGWEMDYHYAPAGLVSGDYCDVLKRDGRDESLMFLLGDVAGKGVAASMLMAQLHAMFHSLAALGLSTAPLIERANSLFCGSTMASFHYATLIAGAIHPGGEVELCNAGHCAALWIRHDGVTSLDSNGFPMGLFHDGRYQSTSICLASGDSLLLYTDGLTEARNQAGAEYGQERLSAWAAQHRKLPPAQLIEACLEDLASFRDVGPATDDLTLMVLRRKG